MFGNLNFDDLGVAGRQSELIELTLSHGFKGFDLDLEDFGWQIEQHGLEYVQRLLASAKLKLGSFRLSVDFGGDEEAFRRDLAELPKRAQTAAAMGCTRCRAKVEPGGDMRPYHENFELCRSRLGKIGEVLADAGVSVGLGIAAPAKHRRDCVYQFIHTVEALLALVANVGADNVGVSLDAWQWHVGGGTLEQIRSLPADKVVAVALADAGSDAGDDQVEEETRLLPGETGKIDSAAILTALAEMGYKGPVTPKPHRARFEGMGREEIVKLAGDALDAVWQSAGLTPGGKLSAPAGH